MRRRRLWGGRILRRAGVDMCGERRRDRDGGGRRERRGMDFRSREETVAELIRPVQGNGSRKGYEEVLEGYWRVASHEFVAKARPRIGESLCVFKRVKKRILVHTMGDDRSITREQ